MSSLWPGLFVFVAWFGAQRRHIEKHLLPIIHAEPHLDLLILSVLSSPSPFPET